MRINVTVEQSKGAPVLKVKFIKFLKIRRVAVRDDQGHALIELLSDMNELSCIV